MYVCMLLVLYISIISSVSVLLFSVKLLSLSTARFEPVFILYSLIFFLQEAANEHTKCLEKIKNSLHDAAIAVFTVPSVRSLALMDLALKYSFYSGMASVASKSQV